MKELLNKATAAIAEGRGCARIAPSSEAEQQKCLKKLEQGEAMLINLVEKYNSFQAILEMESIIENRLNLANNNPYLISNLKETQKYLRNKKQKAIIY